MGNRWGEDVDYEAQQLKDYKGRFTINFKKIYFDVTEINERTLEVTDKHPKDSLMLAWAGTMTGMFIFLMLSYHLFAFILVPFEIFYVVALFRIAGCWKNFKYSAAQYWAMTVGALVVEILIALFTHYYLIDILLK